MPDTQCGEVPGYYQSAETVHTDLQEDIPDAAKNPQCRPANTEGRKNVRKLDSAIMAIGKANSIMYATSKAFVGSVDLKPNEIEMAEDLFYEAWDKVKEALELLSQVSV